MKVIRDDVMYHFNHLMCSAFNPDMAVNDYEAMGGLCPDAVDSTFSGYAPEYAKLVRDYYLGLCELAAKYLRENMELSADSLGRIDFSIAEAKRINDAVYVEMGELYSEQE